MRKLPHPIKRSDRKPRQLRNKRNFPDLRWTYGAIHVPVTPVPVTPDTAERQEAAITKRLDQVDRRMTRLERDVGISVEMLAVFVRFWLATTPTLPEPAAQAARSKAGERYDAFVTALGRRLARGPKLMQEISEDVWPAHARENSMDASRVSRLCPLCWPLFDEPSELVEGRAHTNVVIGLANPRRHILGDD